MPPRPSTSRKSRPQSASATAGTRGASRICSPAAWSRRGSAFVTTVNGRSIIWDTHKDNFDRLKNSLVPPMEQAYAALLDDLDERGLLDTTLVVWMGDFGRTPTINKMRAATIGRSCYTMVLAGGGIPRRPGRRRIRQATAAYPQDRPVTPADIHATIFAALGYDPRRHHLPHHRRPPHAADGRGADQGIAGVEEAAKEFATPFCSYGSRILAPLLPRDFLPRGGL